MCWVTVPDKGVNTDSVVREGLHRRAAEEMIGPRPFGIRAVEMSIRKDRREEICSCAITDVRFGTTPSGGGPI